MKLLFLASIFLLHSVALTQNVFPATGNVGIGTTSPSYALHIYSNPFFLPTNDFKMDGGSIFIGDITFPANAFFSESKLLSNYPIYIEGEYAGLGIKSSSISSKWIDLGIANCNGCFSNNSVLGDVVLRGYSSGSFIITNEATGDIKFATRSLINNPSKVQMIIDKDGKIYGGDATQPSERDNKNSTFIGTTSIIVGPLGHPTGQQQLNKSTGKMEVNITKQPNGIVIYKNGTEQLRLTEKAVRKIIN